MKGVLIKLLTITLVLVLFYGCAGLPPKKKSNYNQSIEISAVSIAVPYGFKMNTGGKLGTDICTFFAPHCLWVDKLTVGRLGNFNKFIGHFGFQAIVYDDHLQIEMIDAPRAMAASLWEYAWENSRDYDKTIGPHTRRKQIGEIPRFGHAVLEAYSYYSYNKEDYHKESMFGRLKVYIAKDDRAEEFEDDGANGYRNDPKDFDVWTKLDNCKGGYCDQDEMYIFDGRQNKKKKTDPDAVISRYNEVALKAIYNKLFIKQ